MMYASDLSVMEYTRGCCAFCARHTHDFPDDVLHNLAHDAGWHACGIDGEFRFRRDGCKDFVFDGPVQLAPL